MKRTLLLAVLVLATGTVVAPAQTAPAPRQGAQSVPAAKITTIATFPGVDASEVAAGAKGNLLYMTADSGVVLVYDRARRKTSVSLKGEYTGVVASPTGDHLGLLRPSDDRKSQTMWTVAVDPATGIATGAPRRVSMTAALAMRISPDGKDIAFIADGERQTTVFVVPFNGGQERRLAEDRFGGPIRWSPDGKWIYVSKYTAQGNGGYVVRIPAGGGTPVEVTPLVRMPIPGLTPDGRYVMALTAGQALDATLTTFDANKNPAGDVRIKFPLDGVRGDYAWSHDGYHAVFMMKTESIAVHAADYAGARNRIIPDINTPNATLSPDNSLVLSEEIDSSNQLRTVLRNADGSNPRVLATQVFGRGASAILRRYTSPWSPDSRYVAYTTDTLRTLMVYDTKTGKSTAIAHAEMGIQQEHFRSDGKAVLYVAFDGMPPTLAVTAREATLEGKTRVLRDLSAEAPGGGTFLGDSTIWSGMLEKLLPFQGAPRPVFEVIPEGILLPPGSSTFRLSLSSDGKWLARTAINRKGIDIAAVDGSTKSTIPVAFAFDQQNQVMFHPNGREVIAPVAGSDGSPPGLMTVPLDGTAPRRLVTLGKNEKLVSYSISSDGKTILYAVSSAPATVLLDVDLSPGIPGKH